MGLQIAKAVVTCLLVGLLTGCDLTGVFVKTQADATKEGTSVFKHWDPELIESALANNLVMSEGYLEFAPDYEPLLLMLILNYVGYGQMWLSEKIAAAEEAEDFDEALRLNRRLGLIFDHAAAYAMRLLRNHDSGFDEALTSGEGAFQKWTILNFYKKRDAEVPLIAGVAWFATMQASEDGLAAATDRPFAEILVKRSVELDPELRGAMGLMVLGIVECSIPLFFGGKPKRGVDYLERAAVITNRENHGILVALAEKCAVLLQDRKLFINSLMEVLEARDVGEYRLLNKFARYKAERLLNQIDELFF